MGKIIKDGIQYAGSASTAKRIKYDNKNSGLTALTAQDAIDEVNVNLNHRPVNNNILINSNFAHPVNQRGNTTYEPTSGSARYTIDRWKATNVLKVVINSGSISLINTGTTDVYFSQPLEHGLIGTSFSLSCKVSDITGEVWLYNYHQFKLTNGVNTMTFTGDLDSVTFGLAVGSSVTLYWVKAEEGNVATPYVSRLFAEELQLCRRYYRLCHSSCTPYAIVSDNVYAYHAMDLYGMRHMSPTITILNSTLLYESNNDGFTGSLFTTGGFSAVMQYKKSSHGRTEDKLSKLRSMVTFVIDTEL